MVGDWILAGIWGHRPGLEIDKGSLGESTKLSHLFFFYCVCMIHVCAHLGMCQCVLMWRPEGWLKCLPCQVPPYLFHLKKFMSIGVLTTWMPVDHVCAESLGLKFEPSFGCWELNSGPLEEQPMLLTAEPSLQLLLPYFFFKIYLFILYMSAL